MSYDLMVFDAVAAPHERPAFIQWYQKEAEWSEDHSYDDPKVTTPALRAWYEEIRKTYPNMNGPGAPKVEDLMVRGFEDRLGDYSICRHLIYVAFPWSKAEEAYPLVRVLAVKYGVGFYDVSGDDGDGEIHFPGQELRPESGGVWREVARGFEDSAN